jgi:hypothetical protein
MGGSRDSSDWAKLPSNAQMGGAPWHRDGTPQPLLVEDEHTKNDWHHQWPTLLAQASCGMHSCHICSKFHSQHLGGYEVQVLTGQLQARRRGLAAAVLQLGLSEPPLRQAGGQDCAAPSARNSSQDDLRLALICTRVRRSGRVRARTRGPPYALRLYAMWTRLASLILLGACSFT